MQAQRALTLATVEQANAADKSKQSLDDLKKMTDKVSGNDFVHLNMAIDEATARLLQFAGALGGGGGGFNLRSGYGGGSGSDFTIFGPGVAGDQPGQPTYDWDSFHNIGHVHGVPYSLSSGDAAMHAAWAEGHYHIRPGETYRSDKDGKLHRWRDTSGSKNQQNEDIFVDKPGASINYNPTYHLNLIDGSGVREMLERHGKEFQRHLARLTSDGYERQMSV